MAIQISDDWMRLIKKYIGFPDIDYLLLEDADIKEFCVFPAMQKYFIKFPIKAYNQYSIGASGEMVLDFPDSYTYGLIDIRISDVGLVMGTGGSFWDLIYYQQMAGASLRQSGGAYGIRGYNPSNIVQQREILRASYKSYQNTFATMRYTVDRSAKQVKAYSSVVGYLNITWAKYSDNFEDIKYERKLDVVNLAAAYLLNHLADSAGILTDSALEMSINVESLRTRAKELEEEVINRWGEFQDVLLLHSS